MPNTSSFVQLPYFVQDQIFGPNAANVIAHNQAFLYNRMARAHFMMTQQYGAQLVGEHNAYVVERCNAMIQYTGTYLSGGTWAVLATSHGLTVANQAPDLPGRGTISFSLYGGLVTAMNDSLYCVFTKVFYNQSVAPSIRPVEVVPYGRTTTGFNFSYRYANGGTNWTEQSVAGSDYFSVSVHGNVPVS